LPSGGSGGEFEALNNGINSSFTNSDEGLRNDWLAVYGGAYGSALYNQSGSGYYWSSTANSATNAYYLDLSGSYVGPAVSYYRDTGLAVRCVAMDASTPEPPEPPEPVVPAMQDFASNDCAALGANEVITLWVARYNNK
jgi:hypothetical protein